MRSDDVRGKQFSTHWLREGYDKKQVAAFLEAAGIRLAAMESTDRPAGPLVSGATSCRVGRVGRLNDILKTQSGGHGYTPIEVDAFREEIRDTFLGATRIPGEIRHGVRGTQFSSTTPKPRGYDKKQVARVPRCRRHQAGRDGVGGQAGQATTG